MAKAELTLEYILLEPKEITAKMENKLNLNSLSYEINPPDIITEF